jgi:hypothetical protein
VNCAKPPPAFPDVLMTTDSGVQYGSHGGGGSIGTSDCDDGLSTSSIFDGAPAAPQQFTVVHRYDSLTLSMRNGTLVNSTACDCAFQADIAPTCAGAGAGKQHKFAADRPWSVDLAEGTYVVRFDAFFKQGAWGGTTEVAFGLIVDEKRTREIIELDSRKGCMPSMGTDDAGPDS